MQPTAAILSRTTTAILTHSCTQSALTCSNWMTLSALHECYPDISLNHTNSSRLAHPPFPHDNDPWREWRHPQTKLAGFPSITEHSSDDSIYRNIDYRFRYRYIASYRIVDKDIHFLPRGAPVHVVLARYCYRKSSVRSPVRLSVTLRYSTYSWTSS